MTTLLPGASEVFTHGLDVRPRSTAFFATSAAATITEGFEVFVQDVMDAIATAPWSSTQSVPSARVTGTALAIRPSAEPGGVDQAGAGTSWPPGPVAGASLAGNDSADASSTPLLIPS